jgi:hypothetical protein
MDLGDGRSAGGLRTHLHDTVGPCIRLFHLPGVLRIERHGFLDVHIFAGLYGRHEDWGVLMMRGRNQNRVDRFVIQQAAVLLVSRRVGRQTLGVLQPARVHIGDGHHFGIRAIQGCPENLRAAVTGSDEPEPDAVTDFRRAGGCAGEAGGRNGPSSQLGDKLATCAHIYLHSSHSP